MSKIRYEGSEQFKPISPWGYLGYTILFAIPIIGFILLIVFALSSKNINRRNYARSFWCVLLLAIIFLSICVALSYFNIGNIKDVLYKLNVPQMMDVVERIEEYLPEHNKSSNKDSTALLDETKTQKMTSETPTPKPETKSANTKQSASSSTTTKTTENTKKKASTTSTPKPKTATANTKQSASSSTTTKTTASTKKASTTPTPKPKTKQNNSKTSNNTTGIRKNIKDAIDSYVEFFREYTNFMKKYSQSSNPFSMLSDYTNMLSKYADTMEKWERFDKDNELNDAELKYYIDATLKIEKMLLEAL